MLVIVVYFIGNSAAFSQAESNICATPYEDCFLNDSYRVGSRCLCGSDWGAIVPEDGQYYPYGDLCLTDGGEECWVDEDRVGEFCDCRGDIGVVISE